MNVTFPRLAAIFTLIATLAVTACATRPVTAPAHPPVLLISIDAFRPDYLDRGLTPNLVAMAKDGARAPYMLPSFPSLTFPNHYTLVTGRVPDHHGIVNNTMSDPALGSFSLGNRAATSDGRWWADAEPIWVTAQKQGLRTATMFWPGTEAAIHGVRPDHWIPFDDSLTSRARVDKLLSWIDEAGPKPVFDTLYFDTVDHAGHEFGPDSPEVNAALREVDDALGYLTAQLRQRGLYDRMNLIVLSDHGMADVPRGNIVFADQETDLDALDAVSFGVMATFNPKPDRDSTAAVARLLGPHEHMHCYRKEDLPARLNYGTHRRVPALLCLADTGWAITSHEQLAKRNGPMSRGEHGYDNLDPTMRALFVARGPSIGHGVTIAPFPNVDVYPLLAHLIGIEPLPNDGHLKDVEGVLATPAH
ncbi:ectonucleotide pyrophosphatase/phosphodiesterase [Luteibacter sp. 22Crub2.1]|uniref:alkaline phosphatase family protein n=1 Tax=Luteibacter sp. 22Crub2.1 TaxID=1283288 RepID=UPI0009A61EA8|nr:ectonucleotide pyrophosphatase/phosphodiesterase [Luteibacter sp. 22Crub2.1]SKB42521.1 Predicted pyrophosphatase or phosphodiesterase, AlkP superfamily [Luteibacter sp. 22Crub2.1]